MDGHNQCGASGGGGGAGVPPPHDFHFFNIYFFLLISSAGSHVHDDNTPNPLRDFLKKKNLSWKKMCRSTPSSSGFSGLARLSRQLRSILPPPPPQANPLAPPLDKTGWHSGRPLIVGHCSNAFGLAA